ncbi:MAG: type 4b pilus protein PilO2 [Rhodobacteraceae bacterium]|nr:type 4b pilus protein PilO2 [Paracoccaceae bacterium]
MQKDSDDAEDANLTSELYGAAHAGVRAPLKGHSWFRLRLKSILERTGAFVGRPQKSGLLASSNISRKAEVSVTVGTSAQGKSKRKSKGGSVHLDDRNFLRAGSHRLAIALQWRTIEDGVSLKEAAAGLSINGEVPDLFVRIRRTPQAGFAARASGLTQGYLAAATAFRDAQKEDWIAVFEISQSSSVSTNTQAWWLVGFRDGVVYDDKLVFDEVTARFALEEHTATSTWERVIAPESWKLPYAQHSKLEESISPRTASRLRSLNPFRAHALSAGFVALVLTLIGVGYFFWYTLQQEELRLLEMEQRRLEEERIAVLQTPPWVGMPTVEEFISVCSGAIDRNLIFSPGWNPGEFECNLDGGRVIFSTTWSDAGGRAAWLLASAYEREVMLTINQELQTASVSEEVVFSARKTEDVQPISGDIVDRALRLRFDTLSLDASLNLVQSRSTPTSEAEQGAPIWNYHELMFRTSGRLEEYLSLLSDIPAIVPMRLSYNIQVHEWSLSLRIYHPPIGV